MVLVGHRKQGVGEALVAMVKQFQTITLVFLGVLAVTLLIWVLRGLRVLGFVPGGFLWILIFACIVLVILSNIR